jgi:hypothetical protein
MSSLAPNPLEFAFIDVSERDMDFLLAEEIECDQQFVCWLIDRTDGVSAGAKVVRVGRSVVTRQGETDLLVVYSTPGGGTRALLIENKIAAPFTRLQAERYRIRGNEGVRDGEWSEFATVLVAPQKRIADKTSRVFDYQISYEECEAAVSGTGPRAQFKRRALRAACQKARIPGIPKVDADHTAWFAAARQLSVAEFPDIPLPAETGRAFNNAWLSVILKDYPLSRVQLEIKPGNGVVDLRIAPRVLNAATGSGYRPSKVGEVFVHSDEAHGSKCKDSVRWPGGFDAPHASERRHSASIGETASSRNHDASRLRSGVMRLNRLLLFARPSRPLNQAHNSFQRLSPRLRPMLQSTPPPGAMTPATCFPSCCSSAGRHGTSWKPMPSSIMANRPDDVVMRWR